MATSPSQKLVAPKPKVIPPSPMGPPTPEMGRLRQALPPGPSPAAAPVGAPAPSSLVPSYNPPPGPAPAPPRPLGSTFGQPGANIQNILSGVTPSRASAAGGGPVTLPGAPPAPPVAGQAPFGPGMQLPPAATHPYQGAQSQGFMQEGAMNDPVRVNTQPKPAPPATGMPLPNGGWDPALAAKSGMEQTAPGPQPTGAFPMPLFNSPMRTPTNQAFPTSPVVPPSYQQPYRLPSSAPLSGDVGKAAALLNRNPGIQDLYNRNRGEKPAPGPDYTPSQSPPTAQATYADRIASGGLMNNNQASAFQRETGMQPGMTVGGRFGLNGPGVDPNSPDTLKRISDAQNVARLGNGREAILASLNRSGYKAPPDKQHDFGLVNSGKFNEGGQRKEAYSPSETQKINDAKALLSSPERQKYLADRKATVDARKAERAPAVQAKAMAKTEARRFRQGIMSNADRLAFMNPAAAAQRDVGKAQVAAASARDRANDATNRDRIASGERIAQGRDQTAQQVSKDRIAAALAANGQPLPSDPNSPSAPRVPAVNGLSPSTPPEVHQAIRGAAASGDVDGIRRVLVEQGIVDPGTQNQIIGDVTGNPTAGHTLGQRIGASNPPSPRPLKSPIKLPPDITFKKPKTTARSPAQAASDSYGVGSGYAF